MDLLLGAVISLLTTLIRELGNKFGVEMAKVIVMLVALVLSIIGAVFYRLAPQDLVQQTITTFSVSVAFYEVITKRVLIPVLDKIKNR